MTQRTHSPVEQTPRIGDAIGHYRIVGVVGSGRLGSLYVAEQQGIQGVSKTVALRHIRPELAQSPHFRALFFDASSIAPHFEHPNVVTIHEMGELAGSYFISMEYLPGESVASILTKGNARARLPPDIAASVVKQAANAVQYLHDRRAVKGLSVSLGPGQVDVSNIFVTYHGTVKLLSAGLGPIHVASGEHRLDASSWAGVDAAVEQIEGTTDPRSDVFKLGVVLWACLTGRPPPLPRAATPSPRMPAPSSLRADVPEVLDAIALRALSLDPLERFQSAYALSEALDQYLLGSDSRPTPKHLRRWLEQLFDAERASLQLQIAQGRDVEGALSLLGTLQRAGGTPTALHPLTSMHPRELWSTSHSVFSRLERGSMAPRPPLESGPLSTPHLAVSSVVVRRMPSIVTGEPALATAELSSETAEPARLPRIWIVGGVITLCALLTLGSVALLSSAGSSPFGASRTSQLADGSGRVEVRSAPAGAAVFVDGEPTGLRTPALLKGLVDGRKLRLRVEKPGFARQEREIEVVGGSVGAHAFELVASVGLVHFAGAPADARLYVDDVLVAVEDERQVALSVGPHRVRVETPGSLIFSGTLLIAAGEQTIRVDGAGATP